MRSWVTRFWRSLSAGGLVLGTLFFVASLTPTLIPRTYLTQGVLSGACFAVGYGIGVAWRWLWTYMELPEPRERLLLALKISVAAACAVIAILFLWWAAEWQNSIRRLMQLVPVTSAHPVEVCFIAIATFLVVIALARLFKGISRWISERSGRFVPRRVSKVIGFAVAILLFWTMANGVLFRYVLHLADSSFAAVDALIEPDRPQPESPLKTGSSASLVRWKELGRAGREFIATGPTAAEIRAFTHADALEPIRVYVGLGAADTAEERAQIALDELKRVGAFERSVLVVITPTGSGWIDPAAMDTVEYLHHGDVASVAQQYSYLSSPLSLLLEPEYGSEAARALFAAVYGYWTTLPHESRPKLYLHGLSLGAMNSERSMELFEMLGDPVQGALWSGPPFKSRIWRSVTEHRNAGSPAWLPQFRDGSFVRFMNQNGDPGPRDAPWGPLRIVYLQYASDPLTFFDYSDFYRRPDWMNAPRGPDVSPELRWYPVVSMLQLALDMAVSTNSPMGYGHVFAPEHYVNAWLAVTDPQGWSADQIAQLKQHLAARARM
ncbi:alpha/beta hydrolase [Mesorhizobium sangaii]|uniref:Putative membrane protein n=1 Tax=Mesorhizobium sangaii TaxID=505389 RepID=A0A841P615_9HYPH|nr:alpha/beta-hydrolase family protein [Mesorhizobium sangaii]MBB6409021.1 putative membrane protein [Mesorhizobium sangaii]